VTGHGRAIKATALSPTRDYLEGESTELPQFFLDRVRNDLGPLWDYLPEGALEHNPNAYLESIGPAMPEQAMAASGRPSAFVSADISSLP